MKSKFKDIASLQINSTTDQFSFRLKKKEMKKRGITPEDISKWDIPLNKKKSSKIQKIP